MENIKQRLSEVVHHWTAIGMITLFLFTNNSVIQSAQALEAKVETQQSQELKQNN